MAPERFVVGSGDGRIGVAVRKPGGFEFLSAREDFTALDGRIFSRARSLVMEVTRHAQRTRPKSASALDGTGLW